MNTPDLPPLIPAWARDFHGETEVVTVSEARAYAAAAVLEERERCAKVASKTVCDTHLPTGIKIYGTRAAAAIHVEPKPKEQQP